MKSTSQRTAVTLVASTLSAAILVVAVPAAFAEFQLLSEGEVPQIAGTVHGDAAVEQVHGRNGIALGHDQWITLRTEGNFDPKRGGLEVTVCPQWQPDDGNRHTIFHIGENDAEYHFTLFKLERGAIRFVIKHDPETYATIDCPVKDWQPNQWHTIRASWRMIDDRLLTVLQIDDGRRKYQHGGQPIETVPPKAYIGRRGPAKQFANAAIGQLRLTAEPQLDPPLPVGNLKPVTVTIDSQKAIGPVRRIHDCTTIWNNENNPVPFEIDSPLGRRFEAADFSLARLVGFSGTWLRGAQITDVGPDTIKLDFTNLDRLIDVVAAGGAEPYIRIAYHLPKVLSSAPDSRKWGYVSPRNPKLWDQYVRKLVTHLNVERELGIEYFVCTLNEADIAVARHGADWTDILKLYERTVKVARDVDPSIKVGGPAICMPLDGIGGECLSQFVTYCKNRDLPVDFICFHRYRRNHPKQYEAHLQRIKKIVHQANPDLQPEWFCDEYNLWARDHRADNEYGAAYLAGAIQYFMRGGLDKLSIVSFNDVLPQPSPPNTMLEKSGALPRMKDGVARFLPQWGSIDGDRRASILAHPPAGKPDYTFGRYTVHIPAAKNPRLKFSTGIAIYHENMDGVGFSIAVADPDEHICHAPVIFEQFQRNQSWKDHVVPLDEFASKTVTIAFRTDRGKGRSANTVADHGLWGAPLLVVGSEDAPKPVYNFVRGIKSAKTGVASRGFQFEYTDEIIRRSSGLPLIKGPVVTAPYFTIIAENKLRGDELAVRLDGKRGILKDDSLGVRACADGDRLDAVLWAFAPLATGKRRVLLRFDNLPDAYKDNSKVSIKRWLIDRTHTNPWHDYAVEGKSHGRNYNLTSGRLEQVEDRTARVEGGVLRVPVYLSKLAVTALEIAPAD